MIRRWLAAAVLAAGVSARGDLVQVREAAVRDRPSFLGRVVASVPFGEAVETAAIRGAWLEVVRGGGSLGWIHSSALARRSEVMRAGDETVDASVSSDELALAGKGFTAEVEARYRARHGDGGFRELDRMEQLGTTAAERDAFRQQGGLRPTEGGRP